jgi:hypothetical protein
VLGGLFLQRRGRLERMRAALHLAGAGEHDERCVIRHLDAADGDAGIGLQGFVPGHAVLYHGRRPMRLTELLLTQMAALCPARPPVKPRKY